MADPLLYSLKEFDEIIFESLTDTRPKSVLEIGSETGELSQRTSLGYLAEFGCPADFALIDGDHNYFTVKSEIEMIDAPWRARHARRDDPP